MHYTPECAVAFEKVATWKYKLLQERTAAGLILTYVHYLLLGVHTHHESLHLFPKTSQAPPQRLCQITCTEDGQLSLPPLL